MLILGQGMQLTSKLEVEFTPYTNLAAEIFVVMPFLIPVASTKIACDLVWNNQMYESTSTKCVCSTTKM